MGGPEEQSDSAGLGEGAGLPEGEFLTLESGGSRGLGMMGPAGQRVGDRM